MYTTAEVSYAHKLNYKIVKIYELYQYSQKSNIFGDYVKVLARSKIKVRLSKENFCYVNLNVRVFIF